MHPYDQISDATVTEQKLQEILHLILFEWWKRSSFFHRTSTPLSRGKDWRRVDSLAESLKAELQSIGFQVIPGKPATRNEGGWLVPAIKPVLLFPKAPPLPPPPQDFVLLRYYEAALFF